MDVHTHAAPREIVGGPGGARTLDVIPIVDEGLGNASFLVDLGDGRALAVDPSRDPRPYRAAAAQRGLAIAFAAETHLHADFVSGSLELAQQGAEILGSALGRREFAHRALEDGDEVDLAGLTLRALATPGHTPEHLAYLLLDRSRPVALFTGGSLLVGAVSRTDLTSPDRTQELARALHRSIHTRLLVLPDDLPVYPTHGAGSFCSAPAGSERTTTIGRERRTNPLLSAPDEATFVTRLLSQLGTYPPYFRRLPEINRRGPRPYPWGRSLESLTARDVVRLVGEGAAIIDARPFGEFAAGHIAGAISIALRPEFATWLGWVAPHDRPLVFVLDGGQDRDDLVRQALKVGYEELAGELGGGMAAWRALSMPERCCPLVAPAGLTPATTIVDVRQAAEYAAGHVAGAVLAELGSLTTPDRLPRGPLTVMCGHGERAMTAASLIERAGRTDVTVVDGGPDDWAGLADLHPDIGR